MWVMFRIGRSMLIEHIIQLVSLNWIDAPYKWQRDYLKNVFIRVGFGGMSAAACQFKERQSTIGCGCLKEWVEEREEGTAKHLSDNQCLPRILFMHSFFSFCSFFLALSLPVSVSSSPIRAVRLSLPVYLLRHCLSISMCLWCVLTCICLFVLPFYVFCMYTVFIAINL